MLLLNQKVTTSLPLSRQQYSKMGSGAINIAKLFDSKLLLTTLRMEYTMRSMATMVD